LASTSLPLRHRGWRVLSHFSSQVVADKFSVMRRHAEHPSEASPRPRNYNRAQAEFDGVNDCMVNVANRRNGWALRKA
jgi:hypothetical protein